VSAGRGVDGESVYVVARIQERATGSGFGGFNEQIAERKFADQISPRVGLIGGIAPKRHFATRVLDAHAKAQRVTVAIVVQTHGDTEALTGIEHVRFWQHDGQGQHRKGAGRVRRYEGGADTLGIRRR
jgi:hypothetical protein